MANLKKVVLYVNGKKMGQQMFEASDGKFYNVSKDGDTAVVMDNECNVVVERPLRGCYDFTPRIEECTAQDIENYYSY